MKNEELNSQAVAFGYKLAVELSRSPRAPFSAEENAALDRISATADSLGMTAEKTAFSAKRNMPSLLAAAILSLIGAALQALDYVIIELYGTVIGLVFAVLSAVLVASELLHLPLPWLFSKKKSGNVVATLSPEGEVKRRLIFVANADSPYLERLRSASPALAGTVVAATVVGLIFSISIAISSLVDGEVSPWGAILNLCFLPVYLCLIFYKSPQKATYGANDNLSGVAVALGAAKYLVDCGGLRETELIVLISGAKNDGNRGAKEYAKTHPAQMQTVAVAVDNFRVQANAGMLRGEGGRYSYGDGAAVRLMEKAYGNLGLPAVKFNSKTDLSDASAFVGSGIDSTALTAKDTKSDYYRTMLDTADNMSKKTLSFGIELLAEAAAFYDSGALF